MRSASTTRDWLATDQPFFLEPLRTIFKTDNGSNTAIMRIGYAHGRSAVEVRLAAVVAQTVFVAFIRLARVISNEGVDVDDFMTTEKARERERLSGSVKIRKEHHDGSDEDPQHYFAVIF
jgi:hypothetical protein